MRSCPPGVTLATQYPPRLPPSPNSVANLRPFCVVSNGFGAQVEPPVGSPSANLRPFLAVLRGFGAQVEWVWRDPGQQTARTRGSGLARAPPPGGPPRGKIGREAVGER